MKAYQNQLDITLDEIFMEGDMDDFVDLNNMLVNAL